jgi:fumarate hydratase subunit alpha
MRILPAAAIEAAVAGLCVDATCDLPQDVVDAITDAYKKETSPGDAVLRQILDNRELARASRRPCCQDTGLAVVFLDIGQEVFIEATSTAPSTPGSPARNTDAYFANPL